MQRKGARCCLVVVACAALGPALRAEDKPSSNPPRRPDLKATFAAQKGFEKATGHVTYRDRPEERFLEVEIDKVPLPFRSKLSVDVNGRPVGTIRLGPLHGGKLRLKSEDGEVVPVITIGSTVTVWTPERKPVLTARF